MEETDRLTDELTYAAPPTRIAKFHGDSDEAASDNPYVFVTRNDDIPSLVQTVFRKWNLSAPDIIISLVGGTRYFGSWKQESHRSALQKGLVKFTNATETWIIDPGLNYGLSRIVGDAVRNEQQFRKVKEQHALFSHRMPKQKRHEIVLMGFVPVTKVAEGERLSTFVDPAKKKKDNFGPEETFGVNPFHTNFVFLNETYNDAALLRVELEVEFAKQAEGRKLPTVVKEKVKNQGETVQTSVIHEQVPIISIVVQGGPAQLDQVLAYMKAGVAVLVINGTGRLADVLSFAYKEYKDRAFNLKELELIKPELTKRITRAFPGIQLKSDAERLAIRDKVIDCLALSRHDDRRLMSVIESSEDLVDIDEVVLPAIFGARPKAINSYQRQIRSDFLLTMKLNKASIADTKVLARDEDRIFQVDHDLFEKALLWKNREKFVDRAMEEDFVVHRFLNHSRLLRLFRNAEDPEFFMTVVWERIPRHFFDFEIDEAFVVRDLNPLVESLSGIRNFMSFYEISSNCFGQYVNDMATAERKALNTLIVWAVLMNRFLLVKTLLKFCDDPIPMALFVSSMYRGLERHTTDASLQKTIHENAKAFSMIAIDILDMSYNDSGLRTFDLLNRKFPDFNNRTPVKLAYYSKNRFFLAHEACQIWLNQLWEGGIEVINSWNSYIPSEVKLVLSALLLFPILFWIRYPRKNFSRAFGKRNPSALDDEPVLLPAENKRSLVAMPRRADIFHIDARNLEDSDGVVKKTLDDLRVFERTKRRSGFQKHGSQALSVSSVSLQYVDQHIPFWRKVYYLWSTPRTKFWVYQVFYWIYLAIFSVATIYPTCERSFLDVVVLFWSTLIAAEIVLRTCSQAQLDFPFSVWRRVVETALILGFALALSVLKLYFDSVHLFYIRATMTVGLIYMYYRMITVFFPMSAALGPMLYRVKKMISVDFVGFFKLALPFILANAFALQSILYPDMPYGRETWRQGFHRAFFALFSPSMSSEINLYKNLMKWTVKQNQERLKHTPRCEAVRVQPQEHRNLTEEYCWVGDYSDPRCPTIGWISYGLSVQYLIIMRLVFVVLLNALFAATMIKVKEETDYIYRFQRYRTVLDFASRPALPPPLSVINYFFNWLLCCCVRLSQVEKDKRKDLVRSRAVKIIERKGPQQSFESYSYWMNLTKEYYRKKRIEERDKKLAQDQFAKVKQLLEDQKLLQTTFSRFGSRLKQLEESSRTYLEEIRHGVERKGLPKEGTSNALSRTSPYENTDIRRFRLSDSNVSWQVRVDNYDPPSYSRPIDQYKPEDRPFVDVDEPVMSYASPPDETTYWCWNGICGIQRNKIDRRTWSKDADGNSLTYALDDRGHPRNPVGRTGLTGRGSLMRYGPNHNCRLIVTRFKDDTLLYLVKRYSDNKYIFPTTAVYGENTVYSASLGLLEDSFELGDQASKQSLDNVVELRDSMEKHLYPSKPPEDVEHFIEVHEIYCGYLDDPVNTDGAWMEIVIYHVHLVSQLKPARQRSRNTSWKEHKEMRGLSHFDEHVMEHLSIHKAIDD